MKERIDEKINFSAITSIILIGLFLVSCTATGKKKVKKPFKHDEPLIKTDVKKLGKKNLIKCPKWDQIPTEADVVKLKKEKKFPQLKKKITY